MDFKLTPQQQEQVDTWLKVQDQKALAAQRASMSAQDYESLTAGGRDPYAGAIGGTLTYSFTPTGLGSVVVVRHNLTHEELDLTDYLSW